MLQPSTHHRGIKRFAETDHIEERHEKNAFIQKKVFDFECKAVLKGHIFDLQLSRIVSEAKYVILFFYSYDFTEQSKNDLQLIENYCSQFTALGALPLAISHDQVAIHTAFATPRLTKNSLLFSPSFPLFSYDALQSDYKRMKRTAVVINNDMQQVAHFSLADDKHFPMSKILRSLT
ncbi:hypothetical protein K501DRAFT_266889 [Backusella circina FSU 941]|nr:hypothetical protein K501DRAFT_266889 [Backusella circina FSU 941]